MNDNRRIPPGGEKLRFPAVKEYVGFLKQMREIKQYNPRQFQHIDLPDVTGEENIAWDNVRIEGVNSVHGKFQVHDDKETRTTMMLRRRRWRFLQKFWKVCPQFVSLVVFWRYWDWGDGGWYAVSLHFWGE